MYIHKLPLWKMLLYTFYGNLSCWVTISSVNFLLHSNCAPDFISDFRLRAILFTWKRLSMCFSYGPMVSVFHTCPSKIYVRQNKMSWLYPPNPFHSETEYGSVYVERALCPTPFCLERQMRLLRNLQLFVLWFRWFSNLAPIHTLFWLPGSQKPKHSYVKSKSRT